VTKLLKITREDARRIFRFYIPEIDLEWNYPGFFESQISKKNCGWNFLATNLLLPEIIESSEQDSVPVYFEVSIRL
jgi:hypothetical protein